MAKKGRPRTSNVDMYVSQVMILNFYFCLYCVCLLASLGLISYSVSCVIGSMDRCDIHHVNGPQV